MTDMREGTDWDAVAQKYENEEYEWDRPHGRTLDGEEARDYTRDLFEQFGRPTLGQNKPGGVSPRRQVRLPAELNAQLDSYAEKVGKSSSQIMREALTKYLSEQEHAA